MTKLKIKTTIEIEGFEDTSDAEKFALLEFVFGNMTGNQIQAWKKSDTNGYKYMFNALAE